MTSLKVLTLNCWGVFTPLACQFRHERMDAIGSELSKAEYDIVLLQEIWTQSDYEKLCDRILPTMPYTHYWHSGMFGTGCCIFSKHAILESFLYRFSLNGYAHRPQHGDWFGGKGVGLAKVLVGDITINVYCTHTHAQYTEIDEYVAHRVVQGYEMGQFIKHTSGTCDAVIVGGDFNFQPKDLGFKLIKYNANLNDAWIDQRDKSCIGHTGTFAHPDNDLCSPNIKVGFPKGKCIDFLLYRNNSGYDIVCEKCYLTMGKVPNESYHYSDHEGVAAMFTIKRNVTAMAKERNSAELEQHLLAAVPILVSGEKKVKASQAFYAVAAVICIIFLTFTAEFTLPWGLGYVLTFTRFLLTCGVAYSFWMAVVMCNREMNGLIAARKDINNLLKSNPQM